jgi:membrane protein implicated in regulation of membrane protease activity
VPVVIVLAFAVAAAAVTGLVWVLRPVRQRTVTRTDTDLADRELAALERSDDPLLRTVAHLTRRLNLAEQFQRRLRLLLRLLTAVVVAVLVVALVVVGLVVAARHKADQRDVDQADARYAGCVQYNLGQTNVREAIVGGIIDGFRPITPPDKTGDLEAFAADLRRSVEARLPFRDCSPSGIAGYLSNPPPDPATSSSPSSSSSSTFSG